MYFNNLFVLSYWPRLLYVIFFSFAIGAKYALASDACIRAKVSFRETVSIMKVFSFNGGSFMLLNIFARSTTHHRLVFPMSRS